MDNDDHTHSGSLNGKANSRSLPPGLDITLEVIEGNDRGMTVKLKSSRTVLGRKDADVVLDDTTVSGKHAIFEFEGGRLFITDNNSTNGTSLNGEPVDSAPVSNMDEVRLGDTTLLVSVVEDKYGAFADPVDEDAEDPRMADDGDETTIINAPLPNPEIHENIQAVLDVVGGPDKGRKFKITHRSTVLGRAESSDLCLDDPTISKKHCQVEIHNKDKMTVKDLASSNGTRLNDRYISAVKIKHGDVIQIGDTMMKVLINIRR